ncbi:site-specific integrase [Amphritea sp.]|uniref:site-specific integrase n=1 Tax=Amphritea sp. TaxID=1872502 RepID=UPI003A94EE62
MAARIPHSYRRNGMYYIRLKWPSKIFQAVPGLGQQFNHSLKTHDQDRARLLIYHCAYQFRQLINFIDTCLDLDKIEDIKPDFIIETLKSTIFSEKETKQDMSDTSDFDFDLENKIHIDIDPSTGTQRIHSDLEDSDANQFEIIEFMRKAGMGFTAGGGLVETSGPTVADVATMFIQEKLTSGNWGHAKTRSQGTTRLKFVVELLGAKTVFAKLGRKDIISVREKLRAMIDPQRERRSKRDGTLSADTARSYFQLCTALVKFAYDEDIIQTNFAADLSLNVSKGATDSYRPFEPEDLRKLLNGSVYRSIELPRQRTLVDSYFWAPLLAMYTGGRINELCQLHIRDIKCEQSQQTDDVIWYFNITDDELDQSTKNETSKRQVPIHNQLIELGFLDYVEMRRQAATSEAETLFPAMKYCKNNGWGRETGRWFNGETASPGYLDSVGLASRKNKTFHSFRHTAARTLRNKGVEESDIAAAIGHEHKTTTRRYGAGYTLDRLQQIVNTLDYNLDLSHISFEEFERYKVCKGRPEKNKHLLYSFDKKRKVT